MKIHHRSATCYNILIFVFGSIFYWHILQSIEEGQTALDYRQLIQLGQDNIFLVFLMIVTFVSIFNMKKWSLVPFAVFVGWISFNCLSVFFSSFDKSILILGFVYNICSFYFYLFLKMELREVFYCPGHSVNNIGKKTEHDFNVRLEFKDGSKTSGYLSNWGQNGCFVVLQEKFAKSKLSVALNIDFEGQNFSQIGKVITSYGDGIGIRFVDNVDIIGKYGQNWMDLYTIIRDRGYRPQDTRGL